MPPFILETIMENYNCSKHKEQSIVGYVAPVDISTTQLLHLSVREFVDK